MDDLKRLISRFSRTGFIILCGIVVIVYIALGFIYVQQGMKQNDLSDEIVKLSVVLAKPPPKSGELQKEYENVLEALAPMDDTRAIEILVGIAVDCGIDISQENSKFMIPSANYDQAQVGENTYQLMKFSGIVVQGDHENVMAFISDLDSGTTMPNMVLTKLVTETVETTPTGEEAFRRDEYRSVIEAVRAMMIDNGLTVINNPIHYTDGTATRFMGDDPATQGTVEGFPDITTTAPQKGYTGNATPRGGYVLYGHDKIPAENPDSYETVNYIDTSVTRYYYTCESDGEVRQWDGPDTVIAREYLESGEKKYETKATLDVNIYSKS